MLAVDFPQSNGVLGDSGNVGERDITALHVFTGLDQHGTPVTLTKWQPNYDDIQAINNGGGIWLMVYGPGMPPISMDTESPFRKEEE